MLYKVLSYFQQPSCLEAETFFLKPIATLKLSDPQAFFPGFSVPPFRLLLSQLWSSLCGGPCEQPRVLLGAWWRTAARGAAA